MTTKIHKKTFTPNLIKAFEVLKANQWTTVEEDFKKEQWLYLELTQGVFLFIDLKNKVVELQNEDSVKICKINESIKNTYLQHAEEWFYDPQDE